MLVCDVEVCTGVCLFTHTGVSSSLNISLYCIQRSLKSLTIQNNGPVVLIPIYTDVVYYTLLVGLLGSVCVCVHPACYSLFKKVFTLSPCMSLLDREDQSILCT